MYEWVAFGDEKTQRDLRDKIVNIYHTSYDLNLLVNSMINYILSHYFDHNSIKIPLSSSSEQFVYDTSLFDRYKE